MKHRKSLYFASLFVIFAATNFASARQTSPQPRNAQPSTNVAQVRAVVTAFSTDGNAAAAIAKLLPMAQKGDPIAQNAIGVVHLAGGQSRPNPTEAFKWFSQSAAKGFAAAYGNLESFSIKVAHTRSF